jgi:hypothetical protein
LPDVLLEARAVELAVRPLEAGVSGDPLGNLGVRDAEPQRPGALVEGGLGDELADDQAIEAACTRLFHADRLASLTAELLQPVIVDLAELLDADLGIPDLGEGRAAEAAENVADPPDREAEGQEADHGKHDALAEPAGRGFAQTSKHERTVLYRKPKRPANRLRRPYHRERHRAPQHMRLTAAARRRKPGAALASAPALC